MTPRAPFQVVTQHLRLSPTIGQHEADIGPRETSPHSSVSHTSTELRGEIQGFILFIHIKQRGRNLAQVTIISFFHPVLDPAIGLIFLSPIS